MAADTVNLWDGAPQPASNLVVQFVRRLYAQAYLDFMFMTRDIGFFSICMIGDLIRSLSGAVAVFLLAERFDGIGVWNREQILFMLGYATLVGGLLDMFFGYNILHISRRLGRGQLDHTLIQPQPLWLSLCTEGFTPFIGLFPVVAGVGITTWSIASMQLAPDPIWYGLFALQLAASCAVVVSFSFLWGSLAFWSPVGAEEISSRVVRLAYQLKMFPLDGLGFWLTGIALLALPLGLVAWYPSRVLLGLAGAEPWTGPVFGLVLMSFALFVFRRGLRQYERTGSQRYLLFGHRR